MVRRDGANMCQGTLFRTLPPPSRSPVEKESLSLECVCHREKAAKLKLWEAEQPPPHPGSVPGIAYRRSPPRVP